MNKPRPQRGRILKSAFFVLMKEQLHSIAQQLQKDFMMFDVCFDVEEIVDLEALKLVIENHCNALLQGNPKKLAQIIYRIDLKESDVGKVLEGPENPDKSKELAELMVARTWQKIQLRELYNSQHNKIE